MKPENRLVELGGRWTPIFADTARDFQHLAEWRSFRQMRTGLRLRAVTSEGERAEVRLDFVTPEVLRVQLIVAERPPATTPMLLGRRRPPVPTAVTADEEAVHLSSGVLTATVQRRPWRLSVSGPDGRTFYRQEVYDRALRHAFTMPMGYSRGEGGSVWCHETFALEVDEALFGLGQHYGALNRRGQRLISWSRDPSGLNTGPLTYINIPFFMSSRGYGLFINQTSRIVYEMGHPSTGAASFQVEEPYLDFFLIYGPGPKEILARYDDLTGCPPVPPLWSFGIWMSRCMYTDRPQVEEVVTRMRELGIPMDVVHLDPLWLKHRRAHVLDGCDFVWNEEAFPDLPGFIRWLAERGVKLSLWENPYLWRDTKAYKEALKRGFVLKMPDGSPAPTLESPDETSPLDFSNPEAVGWWQEKHVPYLKMGVAAFKTDYGEGVPEGAVFSNGKTGRQMHNLYPLLYNRAVHEVIQRHWGEAVVFGRSGYAGSQRYPINWTGDAQCTWEGMAGALRGGLGLSLSGIAFWSHDIGGFWNPDGFKHPDPTLYIRWAQFGLLSSHARFHGIREREPWHYGDEAVAIVREFACLRYRLLPYLYALARQAHETGLPVVRPMWLEYPNDPVSPSLDRQYLLGPYLLVAPVFNAEGRCRPYLPAGRWYDWWDTSAEPSGRASGQGLGAGASTGLGPSGSEVEGPQFLDLTVPLERLPLLPLAPAMDYVGQSASGGWEPIELQVRVSTEASFTFWTPEKPVKVRANRQKRANEQAIRLEIDGPPQRYEVRFQEPARFREVRFEGDVQDASWEQGEGEAVVRLRAAGRCAVVGRL